MSWVPLRTSNGFLKQWFYFMSHIMSVVNITRRDFQVLFYNIHYTQYLKHVLKKNVQKHFFEILWSYNNWAMFYL